MFFIVVSKFINSEFFEIKGYKYKNLLGGLFYIFKMEVI